MELPPFRVVAVSVDGAEQGPVGDAGEFEPGPETADRTGGGVGPVGNADLAAGALLVRFGTADGHDEAFVAFLEIGDVESHELTAAEGAGKPDEE